MKNIRIELRDKETAELAAYRKVGHHLSEERREQMARNDAKLLPKRLDSYYAVELNCEFDEVIDVNRQYDIPKRIARRA